MEERDPRLPMRVALGQLHELSHHDLTFARQLGASGIQLNTPILPGEKRWEVADLRWLRQRCESYGLRLEAIENTPITFYDKAMLGLPGRDEQIAHYQATIRHLGAAGIPVLGYHWMPLQVWRTSYEPGRGGALASAFDLAAVTRQPLVWGRATHPLLEGREITAEEMWDNDRYVMQAVLPVAEEAGVTLALHPDDPPLPSLGGVARIFGAFAGFQRAMEEIPSPNSGLDFCMGCWSEMASESGPCTAGRDRRDPLFRAAREDRLRACPRCPGPRTVFHGVLPGRRQRGRGGGDPSAQRGGLRRVHPG